MLEIIVYYAMGSTSVYIHMKRLYDWFMREHIFKAIFEIDENVLPFLLKKLNVNIAILHPE